MTISIAVGCGNLRRNGDLIVFSFLGITSELFDEFAYWFLNYQPSFYYRTTIPLSILFQSILFQCVSFQILFFWILFLMWAKYTYHCLIFFRCMFYVSLFRGIVYMHICIFVYLSIYWKSGTSDLMVLMLLLYNVPTINKFFILLLLYVYSLRINIRHGYGTGCRYL